MSDWAPHRHFRLKVHEQAAQDVPAPERGIQRIVADSDVLVRWYALLAAVQLPAAVPAFDSAWSKRTAPIVRE
jgi:hypothetical protein